MNQNGEKDYIEEESWKMILLSQSKNCFSSYIINLSLTISFINQQILFNYVSSDPSSRGQKSLTSGKCFR